MLIRTIFVIPVISVLLFACGWVVRRAFADHLFFSGNVESVREAARLAPGRSLYRIGLAELLNQAGEDSRPWLRAAAALKPNDASILIRLGLREEMENQFEQAEHYLLRAASVSKKYAPRWTLANFYFRRGRPDEFWRWSREAFLMSYGDRTPLLQLCWSMSPDADTILQRSIPDRRPVRMDFASFLIARQQYSAAEPLLTELAASAREHETSHFLRLADRLLALWRFPAALAVWNSLCRQELVRYSALAPESGSVLTNGSFAEPTIAHGFDWRITSAPGVFVAQMPAPAGWSISLSGDQPEQCEILSQYLPLEAGRDYRLKYRYRSTPAPMAFDNPDTGIRWRVYGAGGSVVAQSDPLARDGGGEESFDFTMPAPGSGARLVLAYNRASGSTRTEGAVTLECVAVEHTR